MRELAVYGAGGFGREVKFLVDYINNEKKQWHFIGYFDDGIEKGTFIGGFPVLGGASDLNAWETELSLVYAIGNPIVKRRVINSVNNPLVTSPILVHPNVVWDRESVELGEGCIVCAGNILTVDIVVGKHVIFNLACTVGHDSEIGDYSSFMPGINISGETMIEEGVYVGTGATVINRVRIGEYSVIGAGAVVSRSIPAKCTAVGIPAKPIKFHE